jgi:hypothetical protein
LTPTSTEARPSWLPGYAWALGVAAAIIAIGTVPYLFDRSLQGASPLYGWYSWFAFNVTDNCVYLSWMRQYADGLWVQRNLFTTEPQAGHMVNLFYLVLGKIAGWTGLPLVLVYHLARIGAGLAFLSMVWRLLILLVADMRARKVAFLMVAVSSGLGWLPGLWERGFAGPVDTWQPEAVSFLCIYLFPLFTASLALMLGFLVNLMEAERSGRRVHALKAGVCGFVLGNVHTYDVITLAFVWTCWLAVRTVRERRIPWRALADAMIAAIPTAISTGHMLWVFRTETVFARRVAVPTLSPALPWVLLGFGLLIPLALVGIQHMRRVACRERGAPDETVWLFPVAWAVANVLVAYVPVSFQRKMLMGAHVPIAMLAGVGLAWLVRKIPGRAGTYALAVCLLILSLTNIRFMLRDRGSLRHGGETVRAFMMPGERAALEWVRSNVPRDAVVQPLPWIAVSEEGRAGFVDTTVACFTPGLTGNRVHAGHWGETPDFGGTMGLWSRFLMPGTPDAWRRDLLRQTGVRYLIFSQRRAETADPRSSALLAASPVVQVPPYLRPVPEASNEDALVFEVVKP